MSSRALMLLTLLGLGVTTALLAGTAPKPADATQWEYAAYRSLGNRYQWQSPDANIFARDLPDFLRQVGLNGGIAEREAETELLNHFGRQGWELVQMTPPSGTRGTWIFWFKRPRSQ